MRFDRNTKMILALLLVLLGMGIWGLGDARWPVLAAFGLAYLFFPIIQKLEKWGIHRNWAVLAVFFLSTIFNLGLLIAIIPGVVSDLKDFINELPQTTDLALQQVEALAQWMGLRVSLDTMMLKNYIFKHAQEISAGALNSLTSGFSMAFQGLSKWIFTVINIFLTPIFFFYFVSDFEKIIDEIESYIPASVRQTLHSYLLSVNQILRGYLRGQFLVAVILAGLYSVGLLLVGIKFGFLIGLITGLLSFIPYVGFLTGFSLAVLMTLANFTGFPQLMGVLLVFGVIQAFESFLITPRLVGNSVGLSPLVSIIALLIGGNVLGLFGMLLAIPTAAFLKIVLNDLKEEYQGS